MQRVIMKSKIHRATVTRATVDFEGSCGIAPELLRAADMVPGEQVHVVNVTNGSRVHVDAQNRIREQAAIA